MTGQKEKAVALLKTSLSGSDVGAEESYRAASIYEQLGDRAKALEWLDKSLKQGYSVTEMENDPTLGALRNDLRYKKLLATVNSNRK